jgi:hypothetical protein
LDFLVDTQAAIKTPLIVRIDFVEQSNPASGSEKGMATRWTFEERYDQERFSDQEASKSEARRHCHAAKHLKSRKSDCEASEYTDHRDIEGENIQASNAAISRERARMAGVGVIHRIPKYGVPARPTGSMPDAAPNEAENVEQPTTILTHRRLEVNPKASAAWMRRLSGHAMLAAAKKFGFQRIQFAFKSLFVTWR